MVEHVAGRLGMSLTPAQQAAATAQVQQASTAPTVEAALAEKLGPELAFLAPALATAGKAPVTGKVPAAAAETSAAVLARRSI